MPGSDNNGSLPKLLIEQPDFQNQVRQAVSSDIQDQMKVDLLYLAFKEDRVSENEFVEILFHQIINYALPISKRKEIYDASGNALDMSKHMKLFSEARRSFIKFNESKRKPQTDARYSEVGELISFCVASCYLNSPQIAAKMALKTNSEMPVFGLDGIHAKFETDGTLTVYYLESKMTKDSDGGAKQYADSSAKFEDDRKHKLNEYRIVRDLSNLDALEGEERDLASKYFDPYSSENTNVRERFVGIIAYSEPLYQEKLAVSDSDPIDIHEVTFKNNYSEKHDDFKASLIKELENKGATIGKNRIFFLAVPCVMKIKELFAEEVSGEHIC